MGTDFYDSAIKRLKEADRTYEIDEAIDYAFETGGDFERLNGELNKAAYLFRASDKTAQDCFVLAQLLNELPWAIQEAFWQNPDNEDLKEHMPNSPAALDELATRMLADVEERGAKVLERIPPMTEELERIGKLLEDAERTQTYLDKMELSENTEAIAQLRKEKDEMTAKIDAEAQSVLSRVKEAILAESSVSEEEAMKWVNSDAVKISDTTFKFMASPKLIDRTYRGRRTRYVKGAPGPDKETILKEIATIYRLTNGNLKNLKVDSNHVEGRSYYSNTFNEVHWLDTQIDTLYHEVGHALDHQNRIFIDTAKRFVKNRATGKPTSLNKLYDVDCYGRDEKAYPDNFIDPYVGKIYPNSTEVVSMGLQSVANIKYMRQLMLEDTEHLKLILGTLTAKSKEVPDLDKVKMTIRNGRFRNSDNFSSQKQEAWGKAIDEAFDAEFFKKQLMSPKGFHGFVLIPLADGRYELRRRRGRNAIGTLGEQGMANLLRNLYLYITQESELLPDMGVKFESSRYSYDMDRRSVHFPPDWFTPITKLPRI